MQGVHEASALEFIVTVKVELSVGKIWKRIINLDDRGKHGTSGFKGEWLRFGSQEFPNWESVLEYLQV